MGQRQYLSTDPNAGEPVRPAAQSGYLSTDPNEGEPLRVATKSENLPPKEPTWADRAGLNAPTDSMLLGFLRGSGAAVADMAQGATANIANRVNKGGDPKLREMIGAPPVEQAQDVMQAPDTFAAKVGGVIPHVAEAAIPVGGAAKAAITAIPRTARAGEKFQEVMAAAKDVPIDEKEVGDVALRIYQLSERGGTMPKAVRDILKRMTDPQKTPLAYGEARDFASNISRLSANEFGRLNPTVAREVANLRVALNQANANAAKQAGKLDEYKSAMREYAQAMRLREAVDKAVKVVKKAAPWATGAGMGMWMTREIRSMLGSE